MNVSASAGNDRPKHQNRSTTNPVFFMFHYPACIASAPDAAFPSTSFRAPYSSLIAQAFLPFPFFALHFFDPVLVAFDSKPMPSSSFC